jgi:benzoyl-CoA reductase/2-hydroxyglutaryl-CoA dehydratase subunit BcrC/BadD/HgdB
MHVLELPQKQGDSGAFEHWFGEIRLLKTALEERFGVEITDASIRDAIATMNRERSLRRRLAEFMESPNPPLTGRQLLDLKSSISGIPADFERYECAIEMLQNDEHATCMKGRSRVLMTGVPMAHGAERVLDIIEQSGGLVVCQENCTGVKPILDDIPLEDQDPLRAIAEYYFHIPCSVMTRNTRRLDTLRALATQYRPDCVIELIWQACLTYDVESYFIKQFTEQELGVPYLRIETD